MHCDDFGDASTKSFLVPFFGNSVVSLDIWLRGSFTSMSSQMSRNYAVHYTPPRLSRET